MRRRGFKISEFQPEKQKQKDERNKESTPEKTKIRNRKVFIVISREVKRQIFKKVEYGVVKRTINNFYKLQRPNS